MFAIPSLDRCSSSSPENSVGATGEVNLSEEEKRTLQHMPTCKHLPLRGCSLTREYMALIQSEEYTVDTEKEAREGTCIEGGIRRN